MTSAVSFKQVSRHFGSVRAVDAVDLDIAPGEFFAMLGPSGSGKTTCLRLIAGFEQPTAGSISIFGERAEGVPPYRRNVNTVFQDYALFPHLNVLDNVAYGLMVKGVGKAERHKAAEEALALVRLPGYGGRRPGQLSGGQRQRVALARALVNQPKVLLLDEPLGALDLKLRENMQEELKSLQKALGITFVFVTHAEVGSSMIRMRAESDSALAISTSCCSPTRSVPTRASGSSAMPSRSSRAAAERLLALRSTISPAISFSRPRKMLSATLSSGTRLSSWWMMAMPASSASRTPAKPVGRPSTRTVPS